MVGPRYDVIIDGHGYIFWNELMESMPFRNQRAAYSYSPTFVERQNTSGNYGDNQQDFWMTASQNDWSEGEQQKFLRLNDQDSVRKFYMGTNIDVSIEGQVTLRPATTSLAFDGSVIAACQNGNTLLAASSTHLYSVDFAGSITDLGAHGISAAPGRFGIARDDGANIFLTGAGGNVRIYNGSFSTFSSSGADSLCFLNNTLYGFRVATADIVQWDTSGTISTVFPLKGGTGSAASVLIPKLLPYGGKLLIVLQDRMLIYDGNAASVIATFQNFVATDADILDGVVYLGGYYAKPDAADGSTKLLQPALLYYVSGTIGQVWKASGFTGSSTDLSYGGATLAVYQDGVAFTDDSTGHLMFYSPDAGSVSCIGVYTVAGSASRLVSQSYDILHIRNQTTGYLWPSTTVASTGTVQGSLIDFESSLTKLFRGITVEFDSASDGDGGSVDIAYQVASVTGSYTSLKTGAVSGVEYAPSDVTGRSISVQITLNKGTSTDGPVLKRVYVRAAPEQQTFRRCQYVIDCTGVAGKNEVVHRDGSLSTLTGAQLATDLVAAITSATPVSITDRFGTYTAVAEQGEGVSELDEVRPGEFIGQVTFREV